MPDPAAARHFLLERLGLTARADLTPAALVRRLEAVQIDPVNLVARNHELVLFNRLQRFAVGQADYYQGEERVFEYIAGNRALLPLTDLPLFVPQMKRREERHRDDLRDLAGAVRHVLREIEETGPLASRRIEWAGRTHAYWDNERLAPRTKETSFALHILWEIGRLAVVGRSGAEILYDLAERALPADLLRQGAELGPAEAGKRLRHKYYRAFGIFDAQHQIFGWQHLTAGQRQKAIEEDARAGLIEPLPIQGVKRTYWALAGTAVLLAGRTTDQEAGEVRFLSPLDNLLWRRERLEDLFGFAYRWEIYTPQAKRTGGQIGRAHV